MSPQCSATNVAGATRVENKSLQRGTTKMLRAPTLKQWHPVPPNLVHFSIRRPRLFPTCVTLSQGPMQVTTSNLCSWLRCLADHALNVWMEHIQGFIGFSHIYSYIHTQTQIIYMYKCSVEGALYTNTYMYEPTRTHINTYSTIIQYTYICHHTCMPNVTYNHCM